MRYLAIDFGEKRTGLAAGDDVMRIATPVEVVRTGSEMERERLILKAIDREGAEALVVGLPLHMDGSEGENAKRVRGWGESIGKASGLAVHYVDERLTSVAANDQMAMSGLTHKQKKARRDALAAAAILRDFLDKL
ncbi:Holliday junction resolvase RuvX [Poriferisphaera sp. WC338]|uniref:Holliday junction resolvase RuvX n=1 Tax=Poriferisphaera sp. WC338 TaxID=3425129 RepID=UPI003D819EBE